MLDDSPDRPAGGLSRVSRGLSQVSSDETGTVPLSGETGTVPFKGGAVRCPTCGAWQEWSDACRRCRCELALLRQVSGAALSARRRSLRALHAGRVSEALRHARRLYDYCPDQPAARLLAVCHWLQGNWTAAVSIARIGEG
jgi:hypothetical protein